MDSIDPKGYRGRWECTQRDHRYSGPSYAYHTRDDQFGFVNYRKGYTVEDFTVHKRGMNAHNMAHKYEF